MSRSGNQVRAERARQLLDNEVFSDAWSGVEGYIVQQLRTSKLDGTPDSERYLMELVRRLQTLDSVKAMINQYINTGRLEAARTGDVERG